MFIVGNPSSAFPRIKTIIRLSVAVALATASGQSQNGLSIPSYHPRVWFDGPNGARMAQAKTWYKAHPFNPTTMEEWALHYLMTGTASDCTGTNHAIDLAKAQVVPLATLQGVSSDQLRWTGEQVALVYDWCNAQLSPADGQLLRDRWAGATAGPTDPIHIPTDIASTPGTSVITSQSAPFLPNMANNNVIIISGGTNCKAGMYAILGYTDAKTVALDADPTKGANASGCTGRISGYVDSALPYSWLGQWGGTRTPGGNYNWGYYRNEVVWGIALYGESTYASVFLDAAIGPASNSRWNSFLPYAGGANQWAAPVDSALGGILTEGSEYGQYSWGYQTTANGTATLLGRNLLTETNWFREAIYYIIYSTTVAPTLNNATRAYYQMFSMSDDENNMTSNGAYPAVDATPTVSNGGYYGGMMSVIAQALANVNVGKHARQWLNTVKPSMLKFQAAVDPGGTGLALNTLPLDYYSPGIGAMMTKNTWAPSATQMRTLSGVAASTGHGHRNSGDFALLRNGVWLTRETANYSTPLVGPYGQGSGVALGPAHNTIAMGPAAATTCNINQAPAVNGYGRTIRLESKPTYSYQAMDLTNAYRGFASGLLCRDDNPYAGSVQREFLFIRPLETLVIFDRLLAVDDRRNGDTHPSVAPASNVKTVYIHSIVVPTLTSNTATFNAQGQTLKVHTLLPAAPAYSVVNEGSGAQQRLEISDTGQAQSYILNVLQARDGATGLDFTTANVVDNGTYYTLTLVHPTLGTAVVTFIKGATTSGGAFGYSATGTPTPQPLATSVNAPIVDDNGVTWPVAGSTNSTCDVNGDGKVDQLDVNLAVQQALGTVACKVDLDQNGVCNIVDVQRVINATISGVCKIGP